MLYFFFSFLSLASLFVSCVCFVHHFVYNTKRGGREGSVCLLLFSSLLAFFLSSHTSLLMRSPVSQKSAGSSFTVCRHLLPRHAASCQWVRTTSMIAHRRQLEGGRGTHFGNDTDVTGAAGLPHHNITQLGVFVISSSATGNDVTHGLRLSVGTTKQRAVTRLFHDGLDERRTIRKLHTHSELASRLRIDSTRAVIRRTDSVGCTRDGRSHRSRRCRRGGRGRGRRRTGSVGHTTIGGSRA